MRRRFQGCPSECVCVQETVSVLYSTKASVLNGRRLFPHVETPDELQMDRKKLLKKQYRETPKDMGVYWLHNSVNNRSLLAASCDMKSALNRHQAELRMGTHLNRELQADWQAHGGGAFVCEYLEVLKPLDQPGYDPEEDLQELLALWRAKLSQRGDGSY